MMTTDGGPPAAPTGRVCGTQGVDFWWDEGGTNNCWQNNGAVTSDPATLPDCSLPNAGVANPRSRAPGDLLITDGSTGQTAGPCRSAPATTLLPEPRSGRVRQRHRRPLGEDCDPGYPPAVYPRPASARHGPGTVGCPTVYDSPSGAFLCMWDTSQCAGPTCARYGASPACASATWGRTNGNETLDFIGRSSTAAAARSTRSARTCSVVVRNDTQLLYIGRSRPAARTGRRPPAAIATAIRPGPTTHRVDRPPGARRLRRPVQATIAVRNANLGAAATTRDAFVTLRIGATAGAQGWRARYRPPARRSRARRARCRSGHDLELAAP